MYLKKSYIIEINWFDRMKQIWSRGYDNRAVRNCDFKLVGSISTLLLWWQIICCGIKRMRYWFVIWVVVCKCPEKYKVKFIIGQPCCVEEKPFDPPRMIVYHLSLAYRVNRPSTYAAPTIYPYPISDVGSIIYPWPYRVQWAQHPSLTHHVCRAQHLSGPTVWT